MRPFELEILTQSKKLYKDEVLNFQIKTTEGYLTVLKDHIPLIASVTTSDFYLTTKDGTKISGYTSGGILYVTKTKTIYLSEGAKFFPRKNTK